MTTPDPLPCPWCGKAPKLRVDQWYADVVCATPTCIVHPHTYGMPSIEKAVMAWNKRRSK